MPSIRKLPSGNYQAAVLTNTGKRITKAFPTEPEALDWAIDREHEREHERAAQKERAEKMKPLVFEPGDILVRLPEMIADAQARVHLAEEQYEATSTAKGQQMQAIQVLIEKFSAETRLATLKEIWKIVTGEEYSPESE